MTSILLDPPATSGGRKRFGGVLVSLPFGDGAVVCSGDQRLRRGSRRRRVLDQGHLTDSTVGGPSSGGPVWRVGEGRAGGAATSAANVDKRMLAVETAPSPRRSSGRRCGVTHSGASPGAG